MSGLVFMSHPDFSSKFSGNLNLSLYACGLNHVRACLELRERYALNAERIGLVLHELDLIGGSQPVVLSTCNRTEIYAFSADAEFGGILQNFFLDLDRARDPLTVP